MAEIQRDITRGVLAVLFIVGTTALEDLRKTGIRAVQSTPLFTRNEDKDLENIASYPTSKQPPLAVQVFFPWQCGQSTSFLAMSSMRSSWNKRI